MNDRISHAHGWAAKAQSDLTAARRLLAAGGPYDTVCFHAQPAAEKYLKALLAFHETQIPRTHNLEELQDIASNLSRTGLDFDLAELTPYAVEMRYDFEFWPDVETASAAVDAASAVQSAVLALLPSGEKP